MKDGEQSNDAPESPGPGRLAQAWLWTRAHGVTVGTELLVNFLLPFLVYTLAKPRLGDAHALMAASAPPVLWSIAEFARHRRVDALSLLVLAGIALSLLAFIGGGGVRFLQLREQLVSVLIGLLFLGSAAIGKPLIYQLARARMKRRSAADAESLESLREDPLFRRAMMIMTLVWGIGLIAAAALCSALIFVLSIEQYLLVGPIVGYAAIGALTLWTFWYAKYRVGAAHDAAETAAGREPRQTLKSRPRSP